MNYRKYVTRISINHDVVFFQRKWRDLVDGRMFTKTRNYQLTPLREQRILTLLRKPYNLDFLIQRPWR